jgi:putative transposase
VPRQARLSAANIPVHVVKRGHNRETCFFADRDRRYFLAELRRRADRHRVAVHAYVLMTNHVHLLMTPASADGIAGVTKAVFENYTRYVNQVYGRSGTLWDGRYYSCLVEAESYLLTCHRYIESNPVRAGLVQHPGSYRWSSYRANAEGAPDHTISPHPVVAALGRNSGERREAYSRLFDRELDVQDLQLIRGCTRSDYALGGKRFQDDLASVFSRRTFPGTAGRPCNRGVSRV